MSILDQMRRVGIGVDGAACEAERAKNSDAFINGVLDRIQTLGRRPCSVVELQDMIAALDQSDSIC